MHRCNRASRWTTPASRANIMQQGSACALVSFVLAIILVYLLLAAQFASFRDPLILMTTGAMVPAASRC